MKVQSIFRVMQLITFDLLDTWHVFVLEMVFSCSAPYASNLERRAEMWQFSSLIVVPFGSFEEVLSGELHFPFFPLFPSKGSWLFVSLEVKSYNVSHNRADLLQDSLRTTVIREFLIQSPWKFPNHSSFSTFSKWHHGTAGDSSGGKLSPSSLQPISPDETTVFSFPKINDRIFLCAWAKSVYYVYKTCLTS